MCWVGKVTDKKVADKDILVKKFLTDDMRSPVMYFKYELGVEYDRLLTPKHVEGNYDKIEIISGLHCYSNGCKILRNRHNNYYCVFSTPTKSIANFLRCITGWLIHGLMNWVCFSLYRYYEYSPYYAVIPKGATYYENDKGEIVSSKLIINGVIEKLL